MHELDELLQHHGVKGMKWGVRKSIKKGTQVVKTRIKEEVKSTKRAASWRKELRNIHDMDSNQLRSKTNRVRLENEFKRLANSQKVRTAYDRQNKSKDKKDYRNREKLSDKQLKDKVETLRLKDNLRREVSTATAPIRESGKIIIKNLASSKPEWEKYVDSGITVVDFVYGAY